MSNENDYTPRCFTCGNPLVWTGDFMRSEVGLSYEDCEDGDDSVVNFYECKKCHIVYEVIHPTPNELEEQED